MNNMWSSSVALNWNVYASDAKFDFDPKVSNHQAPKTLVNTMDEFVEQKKVELWK